MKRDNKSQGLLWGHNFFNKLFIYYNSAISATCLYKDYSAKTKIPKHTLNSHVSK